MRLSIVMPINPIHQVIDRLTKRASDELAKHTSSQYELIVIRHTPKDGVSISAAYNKGFKMATGEVFCCLHNDVFVMPGWDIPLIEVARRGDVAFPMVNEPTACESRGVRRTAKWQTTGCCFMLSRALWESLGGYDEGFEGYHWEDVDLFMRAAKRGAALVRCNSTVTHHRGATRSLALDEEDFYFQKNFARYKEKWGPEVVIPILSETPQEG